MLCECEYVLYSRVPKERVGRGTHNCTKNFQPQFASIFILSLRVICVTLNDKWDIPERTIKTSQVYANWIEIINFSDLIIFLAVDGEMLYVRNVL